MDCFHSEGLTHLDTLMARLSPLYDNSKNYKDQVFSSVLEDRQLPLQEKARMLLSQVE